jgi:hypothetical protein
MKIAALFLLVVASSTGHAAAPELDAAGLEKALTNVASVLAQRSDANSLAAAALFASVSDATRAEQLAARASAADPKRPDLLWLHAQLCYDVQTCDRTPIHSKLHALDPDNGAAFILRLQDIPPAAADPVETDRLIAAAAASRKVDFYWNSLIAHLAPAVLSTKALPPEQSVVAVIGAASPVVIPPLAGAAVPCPGQMAREERRNQCRAIARALLQGDTVLAQSAGATMTLSLWPADSREARAAQETRRVLMYQISTNGKQAAQRLRDEAAVARYLDKLARFRREQDVIVAEIVEAGGQPTPPADWRPPGPAKPAPAPATR